MKPPLMSKTPLCYTLTPSLVTNSMTYLKFLEQLILATLFRGLETHKSVLLSCCPFSKQPRFTDQQLLEKGQRAKGANSLASLSFLLNFYELSSDRCAAFLCTSSWRASFSFPSIGFEVTLSLQEREDHWPACLVLCASSLIAAHKIFMCQRLC